MRKLLALGAVLLAAAAAHAKEAPPLAADPAVEQRMVHITEELRCLVCQNESLAASQADLAQDLRQEVRNLVKSGKTDQEVRDYLVERYGDFVLYRPRVTPVTYMLWGGPFVLLIVGIAMLVRYLRRRNRQVTETPLTEEERKRAAELLKADAS